MNARLLSCLCLAAMGCIPVGGLFLSEPETSETAEVDTGPEADADTDADSDTDTDSDTDADPSYFEPEFGVLAMYAGIQDDAIVDWSYNGHDQPSYIWLTLAKKEYFDDAQEKYACILHWGVQAVAAEPDAAWMAFDATYEPLSFSDNCLDLDPEHYGAAPLYDLGVAEGKIEVAAMTEATKMALADGWGWDVGDSLFSGNISVGALDDYVDWPQDYFPEMQVFYGLAYSATEHMEVDPKTALSMEQAAAGADGLYYLSSLPFPAPGAL